MLSYYGIGFSRDLLINDFGAKSVIYGDETDRINLSRVDMDWRFEELNVQAHDFTWLRDGELEMSLIFLQYQQKI